MNKRKTITILNKTIKILNTRGWAHRTWMAPDGSMCINSALNLAAGVSFPHDCVPNGYGELPQFTTETSTKIGLEDYVRQTKKAKYGTIGFNDRAKMTKTKIIHLLEEYKNVVRSHEYEN